MKTYNDKQYSLDGFIQGESDMEVKTFLSSFDIIVFHIREATPEHLRMGGKVKIVVNHFHRDYVFLSPLSEMLAVYELFYAVCGMNIVSLQSVDDPIPESEMQELLLTWKKRFDRQKNNDEIQKKKTSEGVNIDLQLNLVREIIDQVFLDIADNNNVFEQHVFGSHKKILLDLIDQLKRLKLGTNSQKMAHLLEQLLLLLNELELQYYASIISQKNIFDDSVVSEEYVRLQDHLYQRNSLLIKLESVIPVVYDHRRILQKFFGKMPLYTDFLLKDLYHILAQQHFSGSMFSFLHYLILLVVIISIMIVIFFYDHGMVVDAEVLKKMVYISSLGRTLSLRDFLRKYIGMGIFYTWMGAFFTYALTILLLIANLAL